jgi:hypothetical protein
MIRTNLGEHISGVVVSLYEVALALVAYVKVGVSILQHKVHKVGFLGHWHVNQSLGSRECTQCYQNN